MDFVRLVVYFGIFLGFFILSFHFLGYLGRKKREVKNLGLPKVSVIIPAYNEEKNLSDTLKSVVELNYPRDKIEILIVNDGSEDNTSRVAHSLIKKYPYADIKAFDKKNGGKGSALNFGIKRAKGEIIIGFDADSMVVKNALIDMIPYFDDPKVMAVTPALKVYKPKGILQRVQAIEYDLGIFLRRSFGNINSIHVTPGPFSAFRKIFFEKHGGFDEKNITEDLEIAMRIQSLNYRIENSAKSIVYTKSPNKLFPLLKQRRRWYFGMIKNLTNYKFLFGRKYGELGMIILPLSVISIFTTMFLTAYYLSRSFSRFSSSLDLYSSIGFDFINNANFKSYILLSSIYSIFTDRIVLFGVVFFISTLTLLIIVNRKVKSVDRPISTFISYIFFVLFYSLLFSIWWGISIVYSLTHRRISW